jgi:mannose-6-phosphate isomerase-like protein (cupin superfamily)
MNPIIHGTQTREEWRVGVVTRMRISELTGSKELCVFEQWCAPGKGAPRHTHRVEEVLSVISGKVEVWLGDIIATLTQNESIIVPAGLEHGFRNVGDSELHMQAILAAGYFEANPSPQGDAIVRWRATGPIKSARL